MAQRAEPAGAHASLLRADPAPGARLAQPAARIVLEFSEPLDRRLSRATLRAIVGDHAWPVRVSLLTRTRLVLEPIASLRRGAYEIDWRSVSADDGHAAEGRLGFGVRAGPAGEVERSGAPVLASGGWLRVLVRGSLDAALLCFAAGQLLPGLLGRAWIVPRDASQALDRTAVLRRGAAFTTGTGWTAVGAGIADAALAAAHAAEGLRPAAMHE